MVMNNNKKPPSLQQLVEIIGEEIGCPSLVSGEHADFKYCCDVGNRIPYISANGTVGWIVRADCYCEKAAARILDLLEPPSSTEKEL